MAGVECDSFMVESENRDEWIAGDETREMKYRRIESTYVDCDNVDSALEALMWEVEMGKEKLKKERKEVVELSQEVEKLRKRMPPKNPDLCDEDEDEDEDRPLCSFEIYEERTKQHCDFEKRVKAMKITWSNTVEDVLEMIKPTKEEYPLLEIYDVRNIVKVRLEILRELEELRIKNRYMQLILEKIATVGDILRMNYYGFKDALNKKPNFDVEEFKGIFESARHYLMKAVYDVMADTVQGKNLEDEPVTEDMKKSISSSIEENDEPDQLNEYEAPVRQYYNGLGFELPREN
ncbi:hypothetical protein QJS10_CPB17g02413 [Acorus calamus]|uniref:Uncharacterized protein n=1 Tax=Acorus calamus TaxID=4465 RepID=A0AAV9CSV8_ACOCL|nr:hypothetical protein QJS10_CPB17g02413 [Acorus calamus]